MMIGQTIHEEQTKAILVANRAIISSWTLAMGDDGLGFAFASILIDMARPIGIIGNAFTEMGWDRVRILLMNKFKGRLEQCGYTARDIPILFEHFDLDADGELGREVFWGIGSLPVSLSRRRRLWRLLLFWCLSALSSVWG